MSPPAKAILLTVGLLVSACAGQTREENVELIVSAAASLTDGFNELVAEFEAANPGVDVLLNLGGSSALLEQIRAGAPVDVFAAADLAPIDILVGEGRIDGDPAVFATNSLTVAVPPDNPGAVTGIDDLGRPELLIGLCAAEVPCGKFARLSLERAGIEAFVDTNEPDVRALASRIELGELDAGIVYSSDVAGSNGGLMGIAIPDDVNVVASYPIAIVADTANPGVARRFIDFVRSPEGQALLRSAGFGAP